MTAQTAEPRVSSWSFDSTSLLCAYAAGLLVAPAGLTFAGGTITVVVLCSLAFGWLWALGQVAPQVGLAHGPQPIRTIMLLFGASVLISYVGATTEALPLIEATAADRGLIVVFALFGPVLLAADGIRDRERLDALIRVIVAAGAVAAAVGILQYFFSFDLRHVFEVAGLSRPESAYDTVTERSGFNRVPGTTLYAIEFSAVLTMVLPLAFHMAFRDKKRRWWVATALIAAAIPMAVSRTGTLATVAVLLVLVPTWDRQRRRAMLGFGLLLVVAVKLAAPGLLGTMRALFLNFNVDPSVQSRQGDYAYVGGFLREHPAFGRGFGTFLPDRYDFLDNQYLLGLIEIGVIGMAMLVGVFAVGIALVVGVRRASDDRLTRDLAISLAAALVVPLVTFATFDFLSFPTARNLAFLLVGCAGALWRIERSSVRSGGREQPTTAAFAEPTRR